MTPGSPSPIHADPAASAASPFLTDEHVQIREVVREFALREVAPIAASLDEDKRFPHETIPKLAELGLLGVPFPADFGGSGLDHVAYMIVVEELSRVCGTTGITVAAHTSLGTAPIFAFGTEEQRRRWVPRLAAGEILGAFALTEPGAGSDAKATKVAAIREGNSFVVNGTKIYCTNGTHAGVIVFTARTDPKSTDTESINAFVVEKGTPGLSYGKLEDKLGLRGSDTRELVFQDCRIPAENRFPGVRGLRGPLGCLNQARYGIAWGAVGAAMAVYDWALQYAQQRIQFGKPIASFQLVQQKLVWMVTEITKAQLLCLRLGQLKDAGKVRPQQVSMAKMNNVQMALDAARLARDILGAAGIVDEHPIIRHMMNLETVNTYEGTHDIHALILGRAITGIQAFS